MVMSEFSSPPGSIQADRELVIWVLSDGKRGHENQSLGLAEALGSFAPVRIETVTIISRGWWWRRGGELAAATANLPRPGLLIGAGHRTHGWLWWTGRRTGAPTVVLMKPSLPHRLFDLCLIPQHDLPSGGPVSPSTIPTLGAINRVRAGDGEQDDAGLILIGGPSKEHAWDGSGLLKHLRELVRSRVPAAGWTVSGSRRTPEGFLDQVREALPEVKVLGLEDTGADWLPGMLARVGEVWVGADSVSMVYEALTGGARVGILPMPLRGKPGKLTRSLEEMETKGWVTGWETWRAEGQLRSPPSRLDEAARCAALVWERLFEGKGTKR